MNIFLWWSIMGYVYWRTGLYQLYVSNTDHFKITSADISRYYQIALRMKNNPWLRTFAAAAKSLQSCPTLCDPIDDGPPGSPVPGILQARTLEWVAISFPNA